MHPVEGDSGAYGRKRVPGEIQVGHGVDEEGVIIGAEAQVVGELPRLEAPDIAFPHPGHHGIHQRAVVHLRKIVLKNLPDTVVFQPRLIQELLCQLPPDIRLGKCLLHQIPEVYHLRPVVPQALGKGVMFRLSHLQVGNVVKQQPLQIFRHQIFQLLARAVEHDFFQPPDLAGIVQAGFQPRFRWHRASLLFCR